METGARIVQIKTDNMPTRPGSRKRNYGYQPTRPGRKMEGRQRSRSEYHTYRWTKASKQFREDNPLCIRCWNKGITTPSQVTDHIIPVQIYGDFWDRNNWQPLCKACNIIKGNEDKKLINANRTANK